MNLYPIPYDIFGDRGTCSVQTTFPGLLQENMGWREL